MPFVYRQLSGDFYYISWPNGSYDERTVQSIEKDPWLLHDMELLGHGHIEDSQGNTHIDPRLYLSSRMIEAYKKKLLAHGQLPKNPNDIYGQPQWPAKASQKFLGYGYAGTDDNNPKHPHNPQHLQGRNNTYYESTPFVGPVPRGRYLISNIDPHSSKGRVVMHVNPLPKSTTYSGTNTFGRNLFLIHGDNPQHIGHSSDGCIVLDYNIRMDIHNRIVTTQDNLLIVLE